MLLAAQITKLGDVRDDIKAAIIAKGQSIGASDAMETYAAKIAAISASAEMAWPDITYSGDYSKRVNKYGDDWYYEWEFWTDGTLTPEASVTADFYLVGGGGSSGNAYSVEHSGGNGGCGYDFTATGVQFSTAITVQVGTAGVSATASKVVNGGTTYTANPGGTGQDGTESEAGSDGTGFTGTYYAYDELTAALGTTPDGCEVLTMEVEDDGVYRGYGAGGHNDTQYVRRGVGGIVLMRIAV